MQNKSLDIWDTLKQFLKKDKIPRLLYHYTSVDGLFGILQTNSFHFSYIGMSNDANEQEYPYKLLKDLMKDTGSFLPTVHPLLHEVVERICSRRETFRPAIRKFTASFSEDGDDLAQWRAYCNGTNGYSVGFNFTRLRSIRENVISAIKVLYEEEKQIEFLKIFLRHLNDKLVSDNKKTIDGGTQVKPYADSFELYSLILKHRAFKHEREWKLIWIWLSGDEMELIKFKPSRLGVMPYVPMSELIYDHVGTRTGSLPIETVIQSPRYEPEVSLYALEFFISYLRDVRVGNVRVGSVKMSDIPLRF